MYGQRERESVRGKTAERGIDSIVLPYSNPNCQILPSFLKEL